MPGQIRQMISFYVSSIANAYWDAMPERLDPDSEIQSIASGMIDDGTMRRIQLQCWRVLDQKKGVILSHLRRAGLPPQECPSRAVPPRALCDDRPYTDAELDSLVMAEEYANAIFDAIISDEKDVSSAPAALASIMATGVLYKQLYYYRWPFEFLFPPQFRSSFFRSEAEFWTAAFRVFVSDHEIGSILRSTGSLQEIMSHGHTPDKTSVLRPGVSIERELVDYFFEGSILRGSDDERERHTLLTTIIAKFIKNQNNLEVLWESIASLTVYPNAHKMAVNAADTAKGIEFSIRIDSPSLMVTQISRLMLNLAAYLESFGLMNLELLDIGKGSLWQNIRAAFSGDPNAANKVMDEAFESVKDALKAKHVLRPKSETTRNVAESTKMKAEAILKIAEAEKLRRSAASECVQNLEIQARAAKLVAEAEETRAKALLLRAKAEQIREETAFNKAQRIGLIRAELAASIKQFDTVEIKSPSTKYLEHHPSTTTGDLEGQPSF